MVSLLRECYELVLTPKQYLSGLAWFIKRHVVIKWDYNAIYIFFIEEAKNVI